MKYIYEFEDGTRLELEQSMKDEACIDLKHPVTGERLPVFRVITGGSGTLFLGSGWTERGK